MNEELLSLLDGVLIYGAAATALVAGILGLLALVPKKKKHAGLYAWSAAIIALVSAGLGVGAISTSRTIDARRDTLQRTQPEVKASLQFLGQDPLEAVISATSGNQIPYSYSYGVTTTGGVDVCGVMLGGIVHDPRTDPEPLKVTMKIPRKRLIDGYYEIQFSYASLYADQFFKGMGKQAKWTGTIPSDTETSASGLR